MFTFLVGALSCAFGMPLEDVSFVVDVDGPLAEVLIEQTFRNDADVPIEAVYAFPLHEEAAVDRMQMEVGDRLIDGVIRERVEAEVAYEEAIDAGHMAALTTQQRPNLFTQTVGNIGPGERVRVRLRVVQPVPHVDGAYELVLPLVAAPRFVAPEELDTWFPPAHERPRSGPALGQGDTGVRAHLDVQVASGHPFRSMGSPSHEVQVDRVDDLARALVTDVPLDRDFVLRWRVGQERPAASLHLMDGHALITLEPPATPRREQVVPRELVWVIDQSCSMSGEPIELARAAMLEALDHMDARDTVRLLRFSDEVVGDASAWPVTEAGRRRAEREIRRLTTHGGTYLLDGVLEALQAPRDPKRERMVVFLTDGLIGRETRVLAAIADEVGDARLFAFGVGPAPNRWLLDEMARFGGGKTTWLRAGEAPEEAMARFVDTIDRPVLTDIEVDWADWEVEETWPRRLPALYAGQPLRITTRVVRQGRAPVVVRGRLGDQPFVARVDPLDAGPGRSVPSTWARQKIANLERDQVWGEVAEIADDILATSLEYQVLSQYTAFLAVDRGRVLDQGPPERVEQPVERPQGTTWRGRAASAAPAPAQRTFFVSTEDAEEVLVVAARPTVEIERVGRGTVLTKEFLNRVPAGRSYQASVMVAPGVSGSARSSRPTQENTFLLDGVNITDPVTGTFATNVDLAAVEEVRVLTSGLMPDTPGAGGRVVKVTTRSGTNALEWGLGTSALRRVDGQDQPMGAEFVHGRLSGPVARDRAWVMASVAHDQSVLGARRFTGQNGLAKLTAQPDDAHRASLQTTFEQAVVDDGAEARTQRTVMPTLRHQWFPRADVHLETIMGLQDTQLGADRRHRQTARSDLALVSVEDPAGGVHDLKLGGDVERVAWSLGDAWASRWLGVPLPADGRAHRVGLYAQDVVRLSQRLSVHGGSRLDLALGRAHVGPRAYLMWDPLGRGRTKLMIGGARRFGVLTLPAAAVAGELVRTDEWLLTAEQEVLRDFALGVHGRLVRHDGLPLFGGGVGQVRAASLEGTLRKVLSRRWELDASWRSARRLGPVDLAILDDSGVLGFEQMGQIAAFWTVPTDPWEQDIGVVASWLDGPLGTVVPDPTGGLPNAPRWTAGLQLSQVLPARKGHFALELRGEWMSLLADERDLSPWVLAQSATPLQAGWNGPRVQGGLRYQFD